MDSPETIDLMRSIYAARLAICEIEGAGAVIPPSCLPVTAKSSPQKGRFGFGLRHKSSDNGSDEIPREVLEQCLQTLESRPQWWTSYSNSRQNALIICQASRIETEKEELLDLHRSIAKSSLKLNNGIRDALRDAAVQSEHQKVFVQAVHALQQRILMEAKQTESFLQRTFGNYLRGLEQGIAGFQDSIFFTLLNIRTGTEVLEKARLISSAHLSNADR